MADKIEPYTLKDAQALTDDAERRAKPRHERWHKLEHMFRTGQSEGSVSASDVPGQLWQENPELTLETINYVLPHLSMIVETVAARDPELVVEPFDGGEDVEARARIGEVTLRYFWSRLNVTSRVLRDMTQDQVVLGNGFAKVGWTYDEEEVDRDPVEVEADLAALLEADRRDALLDVDDDGVPRAPRDPEGLLDQLALTESRPLVDEPWVEYVSPFDIFVPENARRIDETPWIVQRLVLPADQVRANPVFQKHGKEALEELSTIHMAGEDTRHRQDGVSTTYLQGTDVFEHVEMFEFHDLRTRRLVVFQRNAGSPLYEGDLPYSHRHTQFVHLRNFNDGGRRFWSFGDLENIAPIQHQLNDYILEQSENARRAGNKTLVDKRIWTKETREAIESSDSDVVIPVDTRSQPLGEMVHTIERKGLSNDVYAAKDDLRAALQEVLGLSDFQVGGMGADRMAATTAAVVEGQSVLRAAGKREQVEHASARIGLLLLLLCQEFLSDETAVRIAGPAGVVWVRVGAADLVGEYAVRVRVGSTEAVNPSTRQRRALDNLQIVVPELAGHGFDVEPLLRHIVRDLGFDPEHVLKRLPQQGAMPPGPPGGGQPEVPHMDALADVGGPPVPAATDGSVVS